MSATIEFAAVEDSEVADAPLGVSPPLDNTDAVSELDFEPGHSSPLLLSLATEDDPVHRRSGWFTAVAALVISVLLHLWLILTLSGVFIPTRSSTDFDPIESGIFEELEPEPLFDAQDIELAKPDDREMPVLKAMNAASIGVERADISSAATSPDLRIEQDFNPHSYEMPQFDVPRGMNVSKTISVAGMSGEGLIQIETALDRVTWEIASNLKEKKLLVVWLIDASASLKPQREIVAQRFRRIYGELNALEATDQIPKADRPLLSGVVAFGSQTTFVTKEPTDKFDDILTALGAAPIDTTGVENVFTAVSQVLDKWHKYRTEQKRRVLLIAITDEAGDDYGAPLEAAIAACQHYQAKAYVIGPAAPFGRRKGFVPYVAKENGKTYQLPVDLGPEAVVVENIDIPFWYDGPQHDYLSSGFGPYALTRLVKETGGVYFMSNMTTMAGLGTVGSFDPGVMKAFEPDYRYSSPVQFVRDISKHPLRAVVFGAADASQNSTIRAQGTPLMEFRVQPNNFRQVFADAQKSAAISGFVVENILSRVPTNQLDKWYAAEPSLRWRLAFDLNYGRLLAQRVRALEYNLALAQLKTSYTDVDVAKRVNHIILRPDRDLHFATNVKRQAKEAEDHLQRVLNEAPGTPWAMLAARELKDGLGIRVVEKYIPPPPPAPPAKAADAKPGPKIINPPQPPQPQQKAPPPPPEPVLPKL